MTKIGKLISLIGILFCSVALAKNIKVEATVSNNQLSIGEALHFIITVSSDESFESSEPAVPPLSGFELINNFTSSGTSSKLVQGPNGMVFETSRTQKFTYVLVPKQSGQLSIDSVDVVVDGKSYKTKPILIQVAKAGANPRGQPRQQAQPNPGQDPFDMEADPFDEAEEMFNQLLQRRMGQVPGQGNPNSGGPSFKTDPPANGNEAFFLQVELDKTDAYEGEQITVNWYIYTRGMMESPERLKFPDLKGFWKEIIEEVPALNFQQEVINGVPYQRALLASHALFPIKAGIAVVDEFKLRARVRLPAPGFGGFSYGQPYMYTKASKRIEVKVKPLPVEGRPSDFSGAVGNFDIKAKVEGESFPANQPFSLRIRFEGKGNAKLIELPSYELPPTLEIYNTKSDAKFSKDGTSFKEFEVLVIPRQEGDYTIPAISFSMFDPIQRKYIQKATEPITVKITPAVDQGGVASSRIGTETKKSTAKKGMPELILQPQTKVFSMRTIPMTIWFGLHVFMILVLLIYARLQLGSRENKKDVMALYSQRVKKVETLVSKGDWRQAGVEMINNIYFVMGELSAIGGSNQELDKMLDHLPPSVRRDHGQELKKHLDFFQVVGFAPEELAKTVSTPDNLKKNMQETKDVLSKILKVKEKAGG